MNKTTCLLVILAMLSACSGNPRKTDAEQGTVEYKTYHNQFYDYTVEYPDFLIPQGEATNQDGQKFVSEDQRIRLLVYRDYKNNYLTGGNLYTVGEAYEEDLKLREGVFNKKLNDKHYIIEYKIDDILHTDYALLDGDNYFNIRFEYPDKEKEMMKGIIEHVINSFKVGVLDTGVNEPEG